jgi:hypothetical protein
MTARCPISETGETRLEAPASGCSQGNDRRMRGRDIRQPRGMENSADARGGAVTPAPRDRDPEPEAERRTPPIEDHHFQRPIVSPVRPGVRTEPRGG